MAKEIIQAGGIFTFQGDISIWDYKPGHGQLLLRHARDLAKEGSQNLDVIFIGVFYLRIPKGFHSIKIETATKEKSELVFQEIGWDVHGLQRKHGEKNIFELSTGKLVFFVGATAWRVEKNSLEPCETSLDVI